MGDVNSGQNAGNGILDPLCIAGESCDLSASYTRVAGNWSLLHWLVLRIRGYIHKTNQRFLQGVFNRISCLLLHGLWNFILITLGWNLCIAYKMLILSRQK